MSERWRRRMCRRSKRIVEERRGGEEWVMSKKKG